MLLVMVQFRVAAQEMVFPAGTVIDITKSPWNANNTGSQDVTNIIKNAFQWARDRSYVLYFPDGTYLVSNTIQLKNQPPNSGSGNDRMLAGQRIWGQSRENTIIKLKDNASGFGSASNTKYVIDYMPTIEGGNSNMSSYIENLTVDIGSGNTGASGVRFHANNSGCIRNLKVVSRGGGVYGIDLSRENNGPGYVKNTRVEGFRVGILCGNERGGDSFHHYCLDQCEVVGQSEMGIRALNLPVTILKLQSNNQVPAIKVQGTAQCILLEGNLRGGSNSNAAVESQTSGYYFTRDIGFSGYRNLLKYGDSFRGGASGEYTSHPAVTTGQLDGTKSINIPLEEPPVVPMNNPSDWVSVKAFGAKGDGKADDTQAIQDAMNQGGATVYFPVGRYRISRTVTIPAHVRRVDFMFSRMGQTNFNARFAFKIVGSQPLLIERLGHSPATSEILPRAGSPSWTWFDHASTRTVYFKDMHAQGQAEFYRNSVSGGKVFVEVIKCLDKSDYTWVIDGQQLWGRQFNVEDNLTIEATNSVVWLSGGKQENGDSKFWFKDGTVAEIYGHTLLGNFSSSNAPLIINDNSHVVAFMTEYARDGFFSKIVREVVGGRSREISKGAFPQKSLGRGSSVVHYYAGYDPEYVNSKINRTTDATPPSQPTGLTGSASGTTVTLRWTAASDNVGVTQYAIYQNSTRIASSSNTSATISELSPSTTYRFYVKARDAAGNESIASNTVSVTTQGTTTSLSPCGGLVPIAVRASDEQSDNAEGTMDCNLNTRWAADGNVTISYELDKTYSIGSVKIAFYKGNERRAKFDLQVSTNGSTWTTVLANASSAGNTLQAETFTFPAVNAKFVRYVGKGNTSNSWTSLTEFEIRSAGGTNPPPTASASLFKAFAFGSNDYTRAVPGGSGQNYIKIVQSRSGVPGYSSGTGYGYTDQSGLDTSPNNRGSSACGEELYDQFIGVKDGGKSVFRVNVPNGSYRLVAAGGDAEQSDHITTLRARNGGGSWVTLVNNLALAADEYYSVGFGSRQPLACAGASFNVQPASPTITVSSGYLEIEQSSSDDGGDLSLLEIWSVSGTGSRTAQGAFAKNKGTLETPSAIAVYPVPCTTCQVEVPDQWVGARLQVLDMMGRVVYTGRLNTAIEQLNLLGKVSGMAIIKLEKDGQPYWQKIVVE